MNQRAVAAAAAFFLSFSVAAQEEESETEGPWSGSVAFGYLAVSGNTDSESLNADVEVNWSGERWHHTGIGRAIGRNEEDQTTAEAYKLSYELKYDLSQRNFVFGLIDYNRDRFSSYEQQIFEVVGIGRRFIATPRHELNGQFGVGAVQNELVDGTDQNEFTLRLSGDYSWQISENASFKQTLAVSWSDANTFTESITELRAGVVGNVGLSVSYTIRNNSDVVPGTEKTDTWTAVNLDYSF